MNTKPRLLVLAVAAAIAQAPLMAHAEEIDFDVKTMEARGLSGQVADYFKREKRFAPGRATVTLVVNGVQVGNVEVVFDSAGQPCFDQAFITRAGLKLPPALQDQGCVGDLQRIYAQAIVRLVPGRERIELIVPPTALEAPGSGEPAGYSHGGWGGVVNYDVLAIRSSDPAGSSSVVQGGTELGFNADDWIVRSRQTFSADSNAGSTRDHLYAYAQKSFAQQKQVAQAGELYISNSLFSAPQIIGVQAFPEDALRRRAGSGATATGIARSQARVEVRQAGALIYSTLVPPGPFTLDNLPIVTAGADLQVSVIEQDGETRSFTVPFSSFSGTFVPREAGWSAALGRVHDQDGTDLQADWLGTFSGVLPLAEHANAAGGVMLSDKYRALGAGIDGQLPWQMRGSAKTLLAADSRSGTRGMQFTGTLSAPLGRRLSASVSTVQQTEGYRDLTDAQISVAVAEPVPGSVAPPYGSRYRSQYTASVSYGHDTLGGFNAGYARTTTFDGADTQRLTAGWSKTFRNNVTVSANVERDFGAQPGTLAYINVSMPLGKVHVSSNLQYANGTTRLGVSADQQVNDYVGYNVSASADSQNREAGLSGTLRLLPKYTALNLATPAMAAAAARSRPAPAAAWCCIRKALPSAPTRCRTPLPCSRCRASAARASRPRKARSGPTGRAPQWRPTCRPSPTTGCCSPPGACRAIST